MVEVDASQKDPFIEVCRAKGVESLTEWTALRVYGCDSCACIFVPSPEGDHGWYPDRYEHQGMVSTGCDEDCDCHQIPYMMDRNGKATQF